MGARGLAEQMYPPQQAEIPHLYMIEDAAIATVVTETPEDRFDRARADRLVRAAQSAGALVVGVEAENQDPAMLSETQETGRITYPTLMHAIHAAAKGDKQARKAVEMNLRTAAFEITLKSGHISKVPMYLNENGKPVQYGQLMDDVYLNALKYASGADKIFKRSVSETRNGMRIESAQRRGLLTSNYFVVISRYADNLSDEKATEYGFFPDTKSCSIQVVTQVAENELVQETAFVAGVKQKGGERHDVQTVTEIGRRLGADLSGKDDAETIDCAMIIPKWFMPNGVIDLVRLYDEIAGTFFGESQPVQNYLTYAERCKAREASLEPTIQRAFRKLIAEHHELLNPETASQRLHKLIEGELVDRSIGDKTIDPAVFGVQAAYHIEQGRAALASGDMNQVEASKSEARRTAKSTLCPSARNQKMASEKGGGEDSAEDDDDTSESPNAVCIIKTQNCYCCEYNLDGTRSPARMTVSAYHDSQGTLRCMRLGCGAWINENGTKKYIGAIAERANQRKAAEAKASKKAA